MVTAIAHEDDLKIMFIGDASCGKTCLLLGYMQQDFKVQNPQPTTYDTKLKRYSKNINGVAEQRRALITDTCGMNDVASLTNQSIRKQHGFIIVFDLTRKETLTGAIERIKDLKEAKGQNLVCVLAGNKADDTNLRQVQKHEAEAVAKANNIKYYETSARTGENVNEMMMYLQDNADLAKASEPKRETI